MRNSIIVTLVVSVLIISIVALPAFGDKPIWDPANSHYPRTVWSDLNKHGSITGRVTTSVNGTVGVGGAYIAIVNASNESQEYYNTTSDAGGNYQITGINATYSSVLHAGPDGKGSSYDAGTYMYKMYANKSPYGEGWSAAFGIDANQTASTTTSVVIFTKPARITLDSVRSYVTSDGSDNIAITATVVDSLGSPVADGYDIKFAVQDTAAGHGTLGASASGPDGTQVDVQTSGMNGKAVAIYGWSTVKGNNTVKVWYSDDPRVSATVNISNIAPKIAHICIYYPETVWSMSGHHGSVTGRVTGSVDGTAGIGGAYVSIVNASNVSQEYYNTTSDSYGNYWISGVNATYSSVLHSGPDGTTGSYQKGTNIYRMYAYKASNGDGYSAAFGIDANQPSATTTSVIIFSEDQFPPGSFGTNLGPQTVWSDLGKSGSAMGRVTTSVNGSIGLAGAYVALVNASNIDEEYYHTTSDAYGNYVITGINASYSSVLGTGPDGTDGTYDLGMWTYKIHAYKALYGDGYSAGFGIDANESSATTTSVVIFTKPARIVLTAERPYVLNNDADNIKITATMYDALGNTVCDGYNINFTVGNATNNSFLGYGDFIYPYRYDPDQYGSLGSSGNTENLYQGTTSDNTGSASVQFGWVNASHSFLDSNVWAYFYDSDDPAASSMVNASININFQSSASTYISDVSVNRTSIGLYDWAKVSFTLNNAGPGGNEVYLQVLDSQGSLMDTVWAGTDYSGHQDIYWNGCYDNGTHVPDGDYSLKVVVVTPGGVPKQLILSGRHETTFLPYDVALDSVGGVIVADSDNNAIKRIYPNGTTKSIGSGFKEPASVVTDPAGNIYVADSGNNVIKVIRRDGTISTIASGFSFPLGMAIDSTGSLYVADYGNNATKKIYPNGTVVTLSTILHPHMVAVDGSGNVYVTQAMDGMIKEIYTNGTVRTLPVNPRQPMGIAVDSHNNIYYSDVYYNTISVLHTDNSISTYYTSLYWPYGMKFDPLDNLYVADANYNRVLEIYANKSTRTFISNIEFIQDAASVDNGDVYVVEAGYNDVKVVHPDNTLQVVGSGLSYPYGMDMDASGNIYVADTGHNQVKIIRTDHTIQSLGSGFNFPWCVAVDAYGDVYVADYDNNAIKMIYPNNTTITIKNNYDSPSAIDVDSLGNIYVANGTTGSVDQVYGNGTVRVLGYAFKAGYPVLGIAADGSGNVYVPDEYNNTINVIRRGGSIIHLSSEYLCRPTSISIDSQGNLCIVDSNGVSMFRAPTAIESDPIGISVTGIPSSFTYSLTKGWNLISVPLSPSNNSFDAFFPDGVKSHVIVVWAYNTSTKAWAYYTPQAGYDPNTLTTVDTSHGYWVKVDQNESFTIYGSTGSGPTLVQGWNLVGYPSIMTGDPATTYPSAFVIWQYKNNNWNYFTPQSGYDPNTLTVMEPGYGYWVKVA